MMILGFYSVGMEMVIWVWIIGKYYVGLGKLKILCWIRQMENIRFRII
jgi:hypothetical protein